MWGLMNGISDTPSRPLGHHIHLATPGAPCKNLAKTFFGITVFVYLSVFVFVFHLCNLPLWGNVYKQSASLAYFHIYRNPFSQTFFQSSIQNSVFPIFRRTLFSFCYGTIYKYHPCGSVLSCLRYMRRRRNLTALQVGKE